jgi:A/G-specific adenine glycosylase
MVVSALSDAQRRLPDLLLRWYEVHRRDLPWRGVGDAYRVIVSEFMLQQTQVDTVIPYYRRFLGAFPDIQALARAPLPAVLKAWEGLGYYARARNLHRAAQEIVSRFGGQAPDDREALAGLPGFGPYTTAAVLSIVFNRDCAAVDGNVVRVLCRVFGVEEEVSLPGTKGRVAGLAQALLPEGRAGDYNQALMEFGALVCRPKTPACEGCPLRGICVARASGDPERLPVKAGRRARPHYEEAVGIVRRRDGRYLIARRPERGLLGGLWELPGGRLEPGEALGGCCVRGVREEVGAKVRAVERFRSVNHAYTHFSVTIHAFYCTYISGRVRPLRCIEVVWVRPEEMRAYAFPRAHRRLTEGLGQGGEGLFT